MADEEKNQEAAEDTSASEPVNTSDTEPEAPAPDATGSEADASAAPAEQEQEAVHPKERKRRARATRAAAEPARPERSPEERHAERTAERQRKAAARRAGRLRSRERSRARKSEVRETPPRERAPGKPKTRQGVVVSDRAEKTITVRIDTTRRHRRYEKIVRTSRTLHAHDEQGEAGVGDKVIVRESRPLSRTKRWRLVRVVEKAE
jgi:small subunit ribosomal protein S17